MGPKFSTLIQLIWRSAYNYAQDKDIKHSEKQEGDRLFATINTEALEAEASRLRGGLPCSISSLHQDGRTLLTRNLFDYELDVSFEDGITWVCCIRRLIATNPPPEIGNRLIKKEFATLKFLETTKVPAPKVFGFGLAEEKNPVGVAYIFTEKLPGKPMVWEGLTISQKQKIIDQLADIYGELRKYSFDRIGSLNDPERPHEIGPNARSFTITRSELLTIGPFKTLEGYRRCLIQRCLDLTLNEEFATQRASDAYIFHLHLLDLIPKVQPSVAGNFKFYLKHQSGICNHLLVDDDFNITGSLSWCGAYTSSPALVFNSPRILTDSPSFWSGEAELNADELAFARILKERGHQDLAEFVKNGRIQHFFEELCGHDFDDDWDDVLDMFRGLRDAIGVDAGLDWDEWKSIALERYKSDSGLQQLLKRQESKSN